jgi:hypothetical protein
MMGIDATRITNFKPGKEEEVEREMLSSMAAANQNTASSSSSTTTTTTSTTTGNAMSESGDAKKRSKKFLSLRSKRDGPNTKHPMRLIADVIECELRPSKSATAFFVRYTDKTIDYESPAADEIVAKIQFLINMARKGQITIV